MTAWDGTACEGVESTLICTEQRHDEFLEGNSVEGTGGSVDRLDPAACD
eukprot:CAMPEP_0174750530 /NCGR_PEP_ID=MMETSP1094-20130205/97936_1 /TAXON_ID=156173 /ORGANISM="Chrysochromulina brevifilum, Strain UTEX LB 985" /LENGTH=48 /DNA_ID= /DNA_START= /DNA_END= /DNA_ORIENTATION=